MAKNDKAQLSVDDIEQRKKDLNTELESVQAQIQKMDSMRVQLTAQGNAINGAIQQCDAFLQQLGESSPDSSIPSQETNPAAAAVMS
jgi:peptidoglycan hydrolase CwlO-like protein